MQYLNSPGDLNALETRICDTIPPNARHIVVVNAGDGRLARAIAAKVGPEAKVSVVEPRWELRNYLTDFYHVGQDPWNIGWYSERVLANGPIDFLVFYQIHEFWQGQAHSLRKILEFVQPEGSTWISFFNKSAVRYLERKLPPVSVARDHLAQPASSYPDMDYGSWVGLLQVLRQTPTEIWGLLDEAAASFCQTQKPVNIDLRGRPVAITSFPEAINWGAIIAGFAFRPNKPGEAANSARVSGVGYTPNLFQALTIPYGTPREPDLLLVETDLDNYRSDPDAPSGITRSFLDLADKSEEHRSVLVLGCGWGRDLVTMKKLRPNWSFTGIEDVPEKLNIGEAERQAAGVFTGAFTLDRGIPYNDESFDYVFSMGYFSRLYLKAAEKLVKEAIRVAKVGVYQLEDGRGAEASPYLKSYSIKAIYYELQKDATVFPLLAQGKPTGVYTLRYLKSSPPISPVALTVP